jgi:O-antigen ligase
MPAFIVGYYFLHSLWEPYWNITIGGEVMRVTKKVAMNYPGSAYGPFLDRITMQVQQATDAILPVAAVVGFVVAVFSKCVRSTLFGTLLSIIGVAAILTTYTRSMIFSVALTLCVFTLLIIVYRKDKFFKVLGFGFILILTGLAFVFATGMERLWFGRLDFLFNSLMHVGQTGFAAAFTSPAISIVDINVTTRMQEYKHVGQTGFAAAFTSPAISIVDINVTTRMQEYKIAWDLFLESPILGNGLGIKHEMSWETSKGELLRQSVGYVHNWPLYMLMVGGLVGLLSYLLVLIKPLFLGISAWKVGSEGRIVVSMAVLAMIIYGLFFAVFRLITFNLLLAVAWGYMYAQAIPMKLKSSNV